MEAKCIQWVSTEKVASVTLPQNKVTVHGQTTAAKHKWKLKMGMMAASWIGNDGLGCGDGVPPARFPQRW